MEWDLETYWPRPIVHFRQAYLVINEKNEVLARCHTQINAELRKKSERGQGVLARIELRLIVDPTWYDHNETIFKDFYWPCKQLTTLDLARIFKRSLVSIREKARVLKLGPRPGKKLPIPTAQKVFRDEYLSPENARQYLPDQSKVSSCQWCDGPFPERPRWRFCGQPLYRGSWCYDHYHSVFGSSNRGVSFPDRPFTPWVADEKLENLAVNQGPELPSRQEGD